MAKAPPPPSSLSFEAALKELEAIVQTMEGNDAPLEESLAAFERGMLLLRHCQERLATAERKLEILENGALREFAPAAAAGAES